MKHQAKYIKKYLKGQNIRIGPENPYFKKSFSTNEGKQTKGRMKESCHEGLKKKQPIQQFQ